MKITKWMEMWEKLKEERELMKFFDNIATKEIQ